MSQFDRKQKKALRSCRTQEISSCGLTLDKIKSLIGKPAGVDKKDEINPDYKGKVSVKGDKIVITLKYVLTGNVDRARAALKNIVDVYAKGGVTVEFTANAANHDLRIHGASLVELTQGLKLCDCEAALYIGGWAPSYKHYKWSKSLLVNPVVHKDYWKLSDAHEFGHKLGLKHREDGGFMDYPPKKGRDRRKFSPNDKKRIAVLYR